MKLRKTIIGTDGAEISILELKEPRGKDIIANGKVISTEIVIRDGEQSTIVQENDRAISAYMPVFTGLPMALVEQMHPYDILDLREHIVDFFMSGQ